MSKQVEHYIIYRWLLIDYEQTRQIIASKKQYCIRNINWTAFRGGRLFLPNFDTENIYWIVDIIDITVGEKINLKLWQTYEYQLREYSNIIQSTFVSMKRLFIIDSTFKFTQ